MWKQLETWTERDWLNTAPGKTIVKAPGDQAWKIQSRACRSRIVVAVLLFLYNWIGKVCPRRFLYAESVCMKLVIFNLLCLNQRTACWRCKESGRSKSVLCRWQEDSRNANVPAYFKVLRHLGLAEIQWVSCCCVWNLPSPVKQMGCPSNTRTPSIPFKGGFWRVWHSQLLFCCLVALFGQIYLCSSLVMEVSFHRLYNNLSEVKIRKREREREETYARNRERAKEFQKVKCPKHNIVRILLQ